MSAGIVVTSERHAAASAGATDAVRRLAANRYGAKVSSVALMTSVGMVSLFEGTGLATRLERSRRRRSVLPPSGADAGLRFAGSVPVPVLLCWWPDIGAESRIGMRE